MDSTTFSLLSKDQEKNLMIESLSFCVGSSGSVCLSDPVKLGLSARDTTIMTTLEASVGSSSEANSPANTKLTKNIAVEGLDEIMRNLDLEESSCAFPAQKSATY
jgi:protein-arginine kinase